MAAPCGGFLPCRFCKGRVMRPPAAAAATSPWMLAVGRERTRPCCPPRCPPALKGMRIGWLRPGAPPDITPLTADASCWATRRLCQGKNRHERPMLHTYLIRDTVIYRGI